MPKTILIVCCNTEEAWHRRMAEACELEWAEHEHELDLEEAESFQHLEIEFCDMREDVDPYWVSDWFDVAEP